MARSRQVPLLFRACQRGTQAIQRVDVEAEDRLFRQQFGLGEDDRVVQILCRRSQPAALAAIIEAPNRKVLVPLAADRLGESSQIAAADPARDFQHVDVRVAFEHRARVHARRFPVVAVDCAEKAGKAVEYGFVCTQLVADLCQETFAVFGKLAFAGSDAALMTQPSAAAVAAPQSSMTTMKRHGSA